MEEIKVNDYIRTKDGYIGKVTNVGDEFSYDYIFECGDYKYAIGKHAITKHSFNIIDLIEKDDYINGCRVYEVEEQGVTTYQQTECSGIDYNWIHKSEIKNIVTKEQFNSIKYEVK